MLLFSDILGIIGVVLILVAYFLLQINRLSADSFIFSFVNFVGSILILVSLWYTWNIASVVIEIAWLLISGYGIYRWVRRNKAKKI